MIKTLTETKLSAEVNHLIAEDDDLAAVVARLGQPPLWARDPSFATLLHIILEQQVSLASALAAFEKLKATLAPNPLTPKTFLPLNDATLRRIGFSRQKTRYGRFLAKAILTGELQLETLPTLPDDEVIAQLTALTGIGPWTANIYLLMVLGRPDAWPRGDIALHAAMQQLLGLEKRPSSDEAEQISLRWQPRRAVAARILWHHYLNATP